MTKMNKKRLILKELTEIPNISMVCQKVGVSRQTFYRWMRVDRDFKNFVRKSMRYGDGHLNDIAEGAAMKKIKSGHWPSIKHWLDRKSPKYVNQILTSSIPTPRMSANDAEMWEETINSSEDINGDIDNEFDK